MTDTWTQHLAAVAIGTALLALSAHIQVPFWPVRLSMQSFVVLAIGLACGRRLGTVTLLAYLAEGALGLPVFQGGMAPPTWLGRPVAICSASCSPPRWWARLPTAGPREAS